MGCKPKKVKIYYETKRDTIKEFLFRPRLDIL